MRIKFFKVLKLNQAGLNFLAFLGQLRSTSKYGRN